MNVAKEVSRMLGKTTVTVYVENVPSSAVTTTVTRLVPKFRSAAPVTVTSALASLAAATTETKFFVPSRVTVAPSEVSLPSIVMLFKVLSDERLFTKTVNVYGLDAPEAANTVTVTRLEPGTNSSFPETSVVASASSAVAVTETLVVPASTGNVPSTSTKVPFTLIEERFVLLERGVRTTLIVYSREATPLSAVTVTTTELSP